MYENFFGFNERPFKLVPNPAYLFLSKSHEEVLAHLAYAVIQGDGFMDITGEVGTGKTTLCRAFIDNLDNNTNVAYIFNPNLNSVQLLKAINDEFTIKSDTDNTKDLIDHLNAFLIEQKTKGKNTILLIDEAQNLTKDVLEQLRLLSNLETARHKLLHIILVGQPELKETLNSHELRQLGQRISLSCRIIPLTYKELIQYIEHRIHIASRESDITFSRAAYRSIYEYSRGIPRLINMICDRSLLTAFGLDQKRITWKIVRSSIKELGSRGEIKKKYLKKWTKIFLFFSIFCLAVFTLIFSGARLLNMKASYTSPGIKKLDVSQSDQKKMSLPAGPSTDSEITEIPAIKTPKSDAEPFVIAGTQSFYNFGKILEKMNRFSSRHMAIKIVLKIWNTGAIIESNLDAIDNDAEFFRLVAEKNGLAIRRIKGNLNAIKKLDLPVVLAFNILEGLPPVYLALIKMEDGKITLKGGKEDISIALTPIELEDYWTRVAFIPWKNFLSLAGTIPLDSPEDSIITLKMLLRDIGFKEVEISPFYDKKTRQAIIKIQNKYGLHVDGAVGSTTKIALYNERYFSELPHIVVPSDSEDQ